MHNLGPSCVCAFICIVATHLKKIYRIQKKQYPDHDYHDATLNITINNEYKFIYIYNFLHFLDFSFINFGNGLILVVCVCVCVCACVCVRVQ